MGETETLFFTTNAKVNNHNDWLNQQLDTGTESESRIQNALTGVALLGVGCGVDVPLPDGI